MTHLSEDELKYLYCCRKNRWLLVTRTTYVLYVVHIISASEELVQNAAEATKDKIYTSWNAYTWTKYGCWPRRGLAYIMTNIGGLDSSPLKTILAWMWLKFLTRGWYTDISLGLGLKGRFNRFVN